MRALRRSKAASGDRNAIPVEVMVVVSQPSIEHDLNTSLLLFMHRWEKERWVRWRGLVSYRIVSYDMGMIFTHLWSVHARHANVDRAFCQPYIVYWFVIIIG